MGGRHSAAPGSHNLVAVLDGGTVGMAASLPGTGTYDEPRSVWIGPLARGGA
ncbi:hypothetical protein ACFWE0_20745 [Streptomyces diastaticus]|uniref:hypothetical protein n=1 Tax=Streptomyces TaxID=1883 RepID=UPI0015F076E5|nr:hypothetical protein [Streptomyces griseus]